MTITPSFNEFKKYARKGNLVPVCLEVVADFVTPVSLLASRWDKSGHCFLLESVEGGERLGRYSIVSFEPEAIVTEEHGQSIFRDARGKTLMTYNEPALDALARYMRCVKPVTVPGLPRFYGGAVGYLSYESVHNIEKLPLSNSDELKWPRATFLITGDLFVFDNTQQLLKIIRCVRTDKGVSLKKAYDRACAELKKTLQSIRNQKASDRLSVGKSGMKKPAEFQSNTNRTEFMQAVKKAKDHIGKGDIIQVVLSRRQFKKTAASPLDIYRCLRVVNPSPYMFLVKFGQKAVIGSSPEPLVRLEDGVAMTRPIAGTRRRGKTNEDDQRLEQELLKDPKERAEHLMLVDLGRNDLGRVCNFGSVHVPDFMTIERYSHVMHIVSEVRGKLKKGKDGFDLLKSAFPAGTVAGAPKIRAMEIIDDLEKSQRGLYAGAIGYFSYNGNMDMAITIRTLLWDKGNVSIQTGAGIVADSDPSKEFDETENKAAGIKRTVELAESGRLFWGAK